MTKNNATDLLTSVDELFTTQTERDEVKRETIKDVPLTEISDFPDHPFQVRLDEAMEEMAESVKRYGVLVPILVRPKENGGYEMVAGHRRKRGSELAGKEVIPCIIRELTDDEAIIAMVDSNLQREKILPSEKAFAYKMKLEAMKRQGQRTDLTCAPVGHKLENKKTRDIVAEQSGESREQIRRYICLTHLIQPLLEMVDNGQIAMRPAVELSYLTEKEQEIVYDTIQIELCTPSHAQAVKMRRFSETGKLTDNTILSILQEEKPNQKEQIRIPKDRLVKYFPPETPPQKMEETILKALELYRRRQRNIER